MTQQHENIAHDLIMQKQQDVEAQYKQIELKLKDDKQPAKTAIAKQIVCFIWKLACLLYKLRVFVFVEIPGLLTEMPGAAFLVSTNTAAIPLSLLGILISLRYMTDGKGFFWHPKLKAPADFACKHEKVIEGTSWIILLARFGYIVYKVVFDALGLAYLMILFFPDLIFLI